MVTDFSAPSFSLGFDLDFEDDEDDPFIPNVSIQEAETDEDPESSDALTRLRRGPPPPPPPSFSLGLDLDFEEEEEGPTVPDSPVQEDRPVLKRLRRGPPPPPPPQRPPAAALAEEGNRKSDDDIVNFSSQEDGDRRQPDISPSIQSHATCSSSKIFLHSRGVLSSQSTCKLKTPVILTADNVSASKNFVASSNKDLFPRSTVSPIRKIHLLDSDSDDPSPGKGKVCSNVVELSDKKRKGASVQSATRNNEKMFQSHKHQVASFWKDFSPKENVNLHTPALDEFCDEYFKSAKNQKIGHCQEHTRSFCCSKVLDPDDSIDDFEVLFQQKSSCSKPEHNWDFPHPKPPSYNYFFHDDARIRTLIRERLPHFVPIGAEDHRGIQQSAGDGLDYMGQFCPRDGPSQVRTKGSARSSKTNQKRPSSADCKEALPTTGNWVNPRSNATIPKDAGKRRVSAVGSQGGHWFTGQDGRKVYISKNGQELTGRAAYRHYRKESSTGFRRSKTKAATKKKRK